MRRNPAAATRNGNFRLSSRQSQSARKATNNSEGRETARAQKGGSKERGYSQAPYGRMAEEHEVINISPQEDKGLRRVYHRLCDFSQKEK